MGSWVLHARRYRVYIVTSGGHRYIHDPPLVRRTMFGFLQPQPPLSQLCPSTSDIPTYSGSFHRSWDRCLPPPGTPRRSGTDPLHCSGSGTTPASQVLLRPGVHSDRSPRPRYSGSLPSSPSRWSSSIVHSTRPDPSHPPSLSFLQGPPLSSCSCTFPCRPFRSPFTRPWTRSYYPDRSRRHGFKTVVPGESTSC